MPLDGETLMLAGQHYAQNGESDRASVYFERAAGIEGFEAKAKLRQARLLVRCREVRRGDLAVALGPGDPTPRAGRALSRAGGAAGAQSVLRGRGRIVVRGMAP